MKIINSFSSFGPKMGSCYTEFHAAICCDIAGVQDLMGST